MEKPQVLNAWYEENKHLFGPPICNKLMHKNQLSIMFVGGPNTRTDFHLDESSEFFWQMKGNMELPTIQQGKRKLVKINEGEVFLLPSRVPHSPQRPEEGALGLVIERARNPDTEKDGLRWYTDFDKCDEVLYERYFYCGDLGRDLVPVVIGFKQSEEAKTMKPKEGSIAKDWDFQQDMTSDVPQPFNLWDWIKEHQAELDKGAELNLFGEKHPDRETKVRIIGGESTQHGRAFEYETFFYQLKGEAVLKLTGRDEEVVVPEDGCFVIEANVEYTATRKPGSIGMVVTQDPRGNKHDGGVASSVPPTKKSRTE